MRARLLLHLALISVVALVPVAGGTLAQTPTAPPTCADFDAWVWAQTVYEADPHGTAPTLDPDGDLIACPELPLAGFAPARWVEAIPAAAVPAQVVGITDADTLVVAIDGVRETIHLAGLTAPAPVGATPIRPRHRREGHTEDERSRAARQHPKLPVDRLSPIAPPPSSPTRYVPAPR